jgi:polysaccharide biosynthesis protein PslG
VSRPVRLVLVIALSVALVGGLAASLLRGSGDESDTSATPTGFFGIVQGIRLDENDFATMQTTGVGMDRFLLFWQQVEPQPGSFVWGPTDQLVGGFASHGIRPFPTVSGNPAWVPGVLARPPLDDRQAESAWEEFLKAVVARYGRGGSYWGKPYHEQFGAGAKPLPIDSWQVWNEPNLKKYFAPKPSPPEYARLVAISHDAITAADPKAQIVLAGMPGLGDVTAWDFLNNLYRTRGFAEDFDVAALHPYASNVGQLGDQVEQVRAVMDQNHDAQTPLWLTELGWGSGPPNRFGLSKGPAGQRQLLTGSFSAILRNREAWNVQRVFWFDWRDPSNAQAGKCSFCATAGLLNYDRTRKPAYFAFRRFAAAD